MSNETKRHNSVGHPRWNVAEVHEWMRARRDERVLRRKAA